MFLDKGFWALAAALAIGSLSGACGDCEVYVCGSCPEGADCALPGTALRFAVRADGAHFFERPWPADVRLREDGGLDLEGFPNPGSSSMLDLYLETIEGHTERFSTSPTVYFAFDGPLDGLRLPITPAESLEEDARAFVIQLSDGPGRGERIPIEIRFFEPARQFTPPSTLVLRPVMGFPLRPGTRYAAVVTREARDTRGKRLGSPADFERCKYDQAPEDAVLRSWWEMLQPVWAEIDELAGLQRGDLAAVTVFSTQRVADELDRLRELLDERAAPAAVDWHRLEDKRDLYQFEASFEMPEFQSGEPPDYAGGGGFVFDADGYPVVQRTEAIPFVLAVPKAEAPSGGWPVVVYAHGTGGDRYSFIDGNIDVADYLAALGLASVSIDQPLHGARNPWGRDEEIITFNPYNILAARDNFRQGSADLLWLHRLLAALEVPAAVAPGASPIRIDGSRVAFMGHSQGSLNGPLYAAACPDLLGAVFSGAGGGLGVALLEKTEPVDIRQLIVEALMIEDGEFDMDHPLISVFQTFAEPADPLSYARRLLIDPAPGHRSLHLFFSQGLLDVYALPEQAAAMAAACGCAPMAPLAQPIEVFALRGIPPLDPPVSGNAAGPDGQARTAVMVQYPDQGHFAVFDSPKARGHYTQFLDDLLHDRTPTVE
ncbi:MAG: hypothetical protein JXR96_14030 [Deltaproteobacteria bacterium]|nr:hypothetical protein [Deltaproteobacteria bacterium]